MNRIDPQNLTGMHLFRAGLFLLMAVLLLGLVVQSASAQQPSVSDDQVNAVAKQLYCPVCENIPLDVCPTQACSQWRELIRQKLGEGWSDQQIKDYFVAQYGDRVLAEPPAAGLNWLVYILPPLFFIGGAVVVYRVLAKMHKSRNAIPPIPAVDLKSDDPYLARLEKELRDREQSGS